MKNNTTKNIGLGIIGLGKLAGKFATDLAILSNTEIYAVATRSQEKAADFT
jgi:predicted dehydrogenase